MNTDITSISEKALKRIIANAEHELWQANADAAAAGNLAYVYNTEMRAVADGAPSIRGMEMTEEHRRIAKEYVMASDALIIGQREAQYRMEQHGHLGPVKSFATV